LREPINNLISKIVNFSEKNPRTTRNVIVSKELAKHIKKFHQKTRTLQNTLQDSIMKLIEKKSIVLETAHQPNFFPYSGIFKKAIFLEHIAQKLEKKGHSVVCLFSIVDTDFADDIWFASNRFPHLSKNGYMKIGMKIAKKDRKKCMYAIQRPSQDTWEKITESLIVHYNTYLKDLDREFSKNNISGFKQNIEIPFQEKREDLLDLLEQSYQKADNFADMNSIFLCNVINDLMNCSTVFFKYSDGLNAFEESFSRLLSHNNDYIQLYNRFAAQFNLEKIQEKYAPFWYHCNSCEGKVSLQQRGKELKGTCQSCKKLFIIDIENKDSPNLSGIIKRISPRAIPRHYITFDGIGISFYSGGYAGAQYTSIAEKIAEILHFRFPPMFTWYNKDYYTGVLQFISFLQINRILKLDSYDQFLPKYGDLKTHTSQEVEELFYQIESLETEKTSLQHSLIHSQDKESKSRIISQLREITAQERKLKIQIQQVENKISIIDNAIESFRIFPSIIDYLLNMNALSLSEQWLYFLNTIEPSIAKPQLLKTNFSKFLRSKFLWLKNFENNIENLTTKNHI